MPGRSYTAKTGYRYGFNGKENDGEISGDGNQYDYGFRIYNPRLGRFLSVDPLDKDYPWYTPYQFAGNKPIRFVDLDGAEEHDSMMWEDEQYLSGKMDHKTLHDRRQARGLGAIIAGAIVADIYFFKGKATQTVFQLYTYTQLANSFEHNRASTPEARIEQNKRTRGALADVIVGYGMGKAIGVLTKIIGETGSAVYKTFQSTSIRFSQKSIDIDDYFDVLSSMRKSGYNSSKPIDIVKMKDDIYTSLDNTRLMAAQDAGVNVNAVAHNFDDILDAATQNRAFSQYKKEIKTWGEYIETRAKDQSGQWKREFGNGSFNKPELKAKKKG